MAAAESSLIRNTESIAMQAIDLSAIEHYLLDLQQRLCTTLSQIDGKAFDEQTWQRPGGGGGCARVLSDGAMLEKAGVNFSHIQGQNLPQGATSKRPELAGRAFQALGVSAVIHPRNPYVPSTHVNVRFFRVEPAPAGAGQALWWFGGGFDLTPYYPFYEDCVYWHRQAKAACDAFDQALYPRLKQACDAYFYLPHRQEARGIGGIFFDDFNPWDIERCFAFMCRVGEQFQAAYLPILKSRKDLAYGERERHFQLYRRGRYVEFNLVQDRGTLFGLQSGGRIESILMSLPPLVRWDYDWQPEPGSPEAELYESYLLPRDWVAEAAR